MDGWLFGWQDGFLNSRMTFGMYGCFWMAGWLVLFTHASSVLGKAFVGIKPGCGSVYRRWTNAATRSRMHRSLTRFKADSGKRNCTVSVALPLRCETRHNFASFFFSYALFHSVFFFFSYVVQFFFLFFMWLILFFFPPPFMFCGSHNFAFSNFFFISRNFYWFIVIIFFFLVHFSLWYRLLFRMLVLLFLSYFFLLNYGSFKFAFYFFCSILTNSIIL